jgi:hypothetical protein
MTFDVGDILNSGKFSNLNLAALIIDRRLDENEDKYIYCIQWLNNGVIEWLIQDFIIALYREE